VVRLRAEAAATAHHARRARVLQDRAQARASAGASGAADVSRAASQLAELEARRIAIAGERRRAEAVYQELFRTTPQAGLALPFPLAAALPALDATVTAALADNPRLAGAEAEAAALAEDATAAERSRLPALTLRLQGRRFDVTGNPFEANGAASDDLAVTVEAAYPLYAGGSAGARAREARARAQEAELVREVLGRELVRSARSAHAALLARRDELHAVSTLVDAEAATVAAFEDQYRIGRRQLTDLFLAERDLLASTLRLVRMRTELDMARIELLAVTGRLREHFGLHDSLIAEAPR